MAPSSIYNNAVQGETFLPGQIFVFGGFALRANSQYEAAEHENLSGEEGFYLDSVAIDD